MNKNLLLRIFSALALIPLVLLLVWVGGFAYDLMIALVILCSFSEWISLTNPKVRRRVRLIGLSGLAACLFSVSVLGPLFAFQLSLVVWLAVLLSAGRFAGKNKYVHRGAALWLSSGIPYLAWSGIALIMLRDGGDVDYIYALYLLLVVWATDTGAYFFGKMIGGPKLWPQISPKKTWAGLFGGMALAALVGYAVLAYFQPDESLSGAWYGAVLAVVAQAGDFFESYVKRRKGAKDSGALIPGHGGMLDRVDGLLFAALFLVANNLIMIG